jgi:hypothetical protein
MKTIAALLLGAATGSASPYALHEWGTFTTVAGSDGVLLAGLEREEAPLPVFTYSHFGLENGNLPRGLEEITRRHGAVPGFMMMKGVGRPVAGVTVKMETPVIYFHSDEAFDVTVKVGFQGGTISQWYPDRTGGEVLPVPPAPAKAADWTLDFSKPRQGLIEWQARVLSPAESKDAILFKPGESLHWMRPRVPEANAVRMPNGETEGFLFYRGIGAFAPGLTTTVGADDRLQLHNRTGGDIPFAMVFEKSAGQTRWKVLPDGLPAEGRLAIPTSGFTETAATFAEPVYREMIAGLTTTGLLKSEATAMVETWWNSYFAADGLRVFWVVPAAKTDAILPLEVSPAPDKIVRVIVGRSEVLRPAREKEWLALSTSAEESERSRWDWLRFNDRFGGAYEKRIAALSAATAGK